MTVTTYDCGDACLSGLEGIVVVYAEVPKMDLLEPQSHGGLPPFADYACDS